MKIVDSVLVRKAQIIEKCLMRIKEELNGDVNVFSTNQTKQDAILMNLERACQAAIDMAMRMVRMKKLGIPTESRDAFELLHSSKIIPPQVYKNMIAMVGFRNTAVHDYQGLNLEIVVSILSRHLGDFTEFAKICLKNT